MKDVKIVLVPIEQIGEVVGYKQARTHKKKRINKKWRKRYGLAPIYEPRILLVDNVLYMPPCIYNEIFKNHARIKEWWETV